MRASDPETMITPGKVYRALGKRADCRGCLPLFIDTMSEQSALAIPMQLRALRRAPTQEASMKGDEKVIDYLNKALRSELTAVSQY